jgi:signal transduction histidine kinase
MGIGADIVRNGLKLALYGGTEKRTQNIRGILETVSEMLHRKMEQYQIKFTLFIEDPLPDIFCNPSDIYRIISNLMVNAIQAAAEVDNSTIELSAGREQESMVIQVKDNGPGMSEAVLNKLFKLHFTTKEQGSGIGLSVVKKIVEDHQGTLFVESAPGKGAHFILRFPLQAS